MDEMPEINQRRGPDFWCKMIRWMELLAWALALATLCLLGWAKPRNVTLYDRFFGAELPNAKSWDFYSLRWALVLLVVLCGTCAFGIFVNAYRHERKEDHYSVSLLVLGILGLVGLAALFIRMQPFRG